MFITLGRRICADAAHQVGFLAIIDGHPAGLEMVSLGSAYARLHRKLVRSYALEGLLDAGASERRASVLASPILAGPWEQTGGVRTLAPLARGVKAAPDGLPWPESGLEARVGRDFDGQPPADYSALALAFIEEIITAEECQFPTVGNGTDHRYRGEALAGAALVHEGEVIHCAFSRRVHLVKRK
jgi:hypothetical protein